MDRAMGDEDQNGSVLVIEVENAIERARALRVRTELTLTKSEFLLRLCKKTSGGQSGSNSQ